MKIKWFINLVIPVYMESAYVHPGVELPTSPYTSKDKGGLVKLPNN